jgi:hypothetical protein
MYEHLDIVTRIEAQAVLTCLQEAVPYQSRVSRIMRTISEAVHFGQYRNSTQGKLNNLTVSRGAANLMAHCTQADFLGNTILEHPLPLERMYLDLAARAAALALSDIFDQLKRYPLVTVTAEENRRLKHTGWASPKQRYAEANIEVGRLKSIFFGTAPAWTPDPFPD